jgi:hypothetical protein
MIELFFLRTGHIIYVYFYIYIYSKCIYIHFYSPIHVDPARQGFQSRLVDGPLRQPNTKAALCIFKLPLGQETGPGGVAVEKPVA